MTNSNSNARAWSVTLAALGINLILGSLYAWSVIGKALVGQWKWEKTDAALPFSVSTAAFALTMIFAGRVQDKIGPRKVALLGGFMFGLGLITSGFAHSPFVMSLTYGVLGGMGLGLCYSSTTPPAIKWFPPAKKGLITGIVVSGVGIAAVYVSPLTAYLLGQTNISQTFIILGSGALVLITLLALVLSNPPAGYVPAGAAPAATAAKAPVAARPDLDWHQMLKTPQFYQLWLMFVLSASAGLMIIALLATIAKEQVKWEWGFIAVAMLAIFNTLGRVVSGFLSDRIGRPKTMTLAFAVQAANMFAFSHYTTEPLLLFGASLAGLCYGTIFTLMPAATADIYGMRNLGVNYGFVFTAFGVGGVCGPLLGGKIFQATHSFATAYTISAAMLAVGAILSVTVRPPKPAPAEAAVPQAAAKS